MPRLLGMVAVGRAAAGKTSTDDSDGEWQKIRKLEVTEVSGRERGKLASKNMVLTSVRVRRELILHGSSLDDSTGVDYAEL